MESVYKSLEDGTSDLCLDVSPVLYALCCKFSQNLFMFQVSGRITEIFSFLAFYFDHLPTASCKFCRHSIINFYSMYNTLNTKAFITILIRTMDSSTVKIDVYMFYPKRHR